jgi:anthranilate synthase component II
VILVLDNRDSFTFNLVQALQRLGAGVEVLRSSRTSVEEIARRRPEGILIGPGPGRPEDAGCSVAVVRELASKIPTLGVCLGHQAIGAVFGARIEQAPEIRHGQAVEVNHDGRGLFAGLRSPARFGRYNSLTVRPDEIADCLEISARAADGEIMGLRHREWPLEGVQFHPESVLSEAGELLLGNFLRRR